MVPKSRLLGGLLWSKSWKNLYQTRLAKTSCFTSSPPRNSRFGRSWFQCILLLFLTCFSIENYIEIQLKFHIDLDSDSVSFEARLGSFWFNFWRLWEVLGAPWGAEGNPKRVPKEVLAPKSLQVASGTSFFTIWDALGPLLGRFLRGPWGAKWEPEGLQDSQDAPKIPP